MLDFSSTLKSHNKEKDNSITNSNLNDKSISASLISDTSPVYLFCTSKNGINSKNENGWTPIYRSIIANNLVALNELLNLGSDPNISNNLGETPLYLCVDIDNYDALIILLQYNADTNIAKRNGTTPLHLAAKKNKDNYMHALLRNKANPNLQNKLYSQTATHIAILNKINEDMLNIFHEYNADIYNIKDKYDKTPFDYAKELKDDEYVQLIINIFGDKNNRKQPKTLNINKLPEEIQKNNDIILNIPKNLHNSNYNIPPEKISINKNEENENKIVEILIEDKKMENNNKNKYNNNENKKNINESDDKPKKYGILSSGDPLYSDRSNYQESESNKSKKDKTNNDIINILNKNNLSEFQPNPSNNENNEIKQKNSLIKNLKNNINIDTKMIDNSKDIILLNNENNDSDHNNDNSNNNIEKREENEMKFEIENEKNNLNLNYFNKINENNDNDIENKINYINEPNDENKFRGDNTDKEIIKNIISSTIKKIKVNSNTYNSEYSSLNNNSINQNNNNSTSKVEVLKLINFSSNNISNKENLENKLSNNTNLDNYIISNNNNLEDGTSSFILYNSKKNENDQKNNCISEKMKISEITPISNNKLDNQTHTDNSNIFSEIQINNITNENCNKNDNNISQNEEEINNEELLELEIKTEKKEKEENINKNNDLNDENIHNNENNNLNNENMQNNESKNNNNLTNSSEKYIYDGSLEYSKSKSYLTNELSLNNQNQNNNNIVNISNNNPLINQHHRQISYHNNKSSMNKRKKDGEIQNEESYNISLNKENDNPNNNEIIYYNKNYLAGNNTSKKDENISIKEKNTVIQRNIPEKKHTQSDLDNNIQRYKSITNKTSSINQKVFTYTSPNINKKHYLINTKSNNNNMEKENINMDSNNNLNNIILNTNPNMNISNLNGTKEEFFSINNNLSSFLNTNKIGSIKDKHNTFLRESNNNDNSTFNVYDDIVETKNLDKKINLYSANQNEGNNNSNNNNDNNHKNISKNENKIRNNYRGSSMGNTTISSLAKNNNPGKQSLTSVINNNSNILLTDRNSNINNIMNQSNNIIKNIPVNMLLRLRDWLISCDLLCYYNVLIENNMYDIDKCINDLQNNKLNISYKEIEDLGIRKPGHIFRLLLKLEIDSGILDNNLFNYILSKFNMSSSISNNIILTSSITDINCCGICNKNKNYQSYIKRNDCPYNDIFSFLKYKDLWKYKENFLHNGFDQLEYVLLQLFSKYPYDKDIMNDCFHIYNDNDKIYVLNKLYEEKRSLSLECGIDTNENEINQILSNYSYSSKYSSKKKNINNFENINKTNNEKNYCNIF